LRKKKAQQTRKLRLYAYHYFCLRNLSQKVRLQVKNTNLS
jgi:hypothetical protein